ncbi:unnamed protein product [Durusdinium trenchii]|uniref:SAP domain-containing protein n=1 Tax=Durusdinium trenchii TaxID=1381693 RepID=A0ABP0J3W3_9DINO
MKRPAEEMDSEVPLNPETPFEHLGSKDGVEEPAAKRQASPCSTAASTPELGPSTSPEARDHAHHSDLWQLPVKELKARLTSLGTDLKGVTEKTELIILLEQLQPSSEGVPPFEL